MCLSLDCIPIVIYIPLFELLLLVVVLNPILYRELPEMPDHQEEPGLTVERPELQPKLSEHLPEPPEHQPEPSTG